MDLTSSSDNKVQILLGVWGKKFIADFLQYGLLSLLAPGNVPAIAKAFPTRFIFLTRSHDVEIFEKNSVFRKLKSICEVEFIAIDDLIVYGNHSTTITFAYDRAIRRVGREMLKTYFVFLTSDYIMADGSLAGLLKYIKKGYSGICAGNFQVIEEEMKPFLKKCLDPEEKSLRISPRELLKESLQHLHTTSIASFYESKILNNYLVNRFFKRIDAETVIGRFYLLHMLCIKPETTEYQIGSSCDYSFIPELCPSNNVAIIDDSDDYLVVEMQSQKHEAVKNVNFGAYDVHRLAKALAEWTTVQHRKNAEHIIYYHCNDLAADTKNRIQQEPDLFLDALAKRLQNHTPQSHRDHLYWRGATDAFNQAKHIIQEEDTSTYFDFSSINHSKLVKFSRSFFGNPPYVSRAHYRWLEYQSTKEALRSFFSLYSAEKSIVIYDGSDSDFMGYCGWLKQDLKVTQHYHLSGLENTKLILKQVREKQNEVCLLFVKFQNLKNIKKSLAMLRSIVSPQAKILVSIFNGSRDHPAFLYNFPKDFATNLHHFSGSAYVIENIITIRNSFSFFGAFLLKCINEMCGNKKFLRYPAYLVLGILGTPITFVRNCLAPRPKRKGVCTNMLVTFAPQNVKEN